MCAWLRLVSLVVPRYRRAEWLEEWRAEIDQDVDPARARAHHPASVGRGALSHAFWIRRLEWSFAMKDLRYALRLAGRNPGFAAIVIATLALGIGAATAMFSVVNGVLLKPLPYHDPERLVWMFGAFRQNDSAAVSPLDFRDYRDRNEVFATLGALAGGLPAVTVAGPDGPERFASASITAGVISALGIPPALGRDFTRDEERTTGPQSVVLGHRFWQDRFAGAPGALGQSLTIDGRPHTIVGVMPEGFRLPTTASAPGAGPDLFLPFPFDTDTARVRGYHYLRLVGRLEPDVTMEAAQSHMDVIARQLEVAYPESNETWRLRLLSLEERVVGDVRDTLLIMMSAVLLVLVVACANVAGLLLARASSRQGEVSIRRALGASRARVVRQFLMEGLVFAVAGSAAGLVLAGWAVGLVRRASPGNLPRLEDVSLDPIVVIFAIAAGVGTTLLFALLPALQTSGSAHVASIRDGARTAGSVRTARLRGTLVAAQVAMSTMLLIGAGLLVRSFVELTSVDPGFASANVLVSRVTLPDRYENDTDIEQFYSRLLDKIGAAPGVELASMSTTPPLMGGNDINTFPEGQPPATQAESRYAQLQWIRGRYFEASGVPIVKGRGLDESLDTPSTPHVAVINRGMAERYFPGVDPIGRRLVANFSDPVTLEIVGIAGDARVFGQDEDAPDMLYMSARQFPSSWMTVVVRTSTPPSGFVPVLRSALRELDASLALGSVQTMDSLLDRSVAAPRFRTGLIASFAIVALVLTIVGLYGTLAYAVSQRTREIGIRFALGAQSRSVVGLVLRQGAVFVLVGALVGIAAAFGLTRLLQDMLFQVTPRDTAVFAGVPLVIAAVAGLAMLAPARRASKLDPVKALRS
jgi:putative ABC transport system permease protein